MSNVTSIRSGTGSPPEGPAGDEPEAHEPARFLRLRFQDEDEDFTSQDLINGLRGVCSALDEAAVNHSCRDIDHVGDLAMAAKVLSQMLGDRSEDVVEEEAKP
jgi:hypothetical protein